MLQQQVRWTIEAIQAAPSILAARSRLVFGNQCRDKLAGQLKQYSVTSAMFLYGLQGLRTAKGQIAFQLFDCAAPRLA